MSKSKHTEAQMIAALKQVEAGRKVEDVAREVGVSKHTLYAWKAKYGGIDVTEAQEAKQLRDENTRLRKLVADLSLDKEALQSAVLGHLLPALVKQFRPWKEASSVASTGVDAAEFASGVGLVKLGYDGLSYAAGLFSCATN